MAESLSPAAPVRPGRPGLAIIANSLTPYRLHLHRRLVAELPEVVLHSVFTHETSNSAWAYQADPAINPVLFGPGEVATRQDRLGNALHEWYKGGQILHWMARQHIAAAIVLGYNDLGRLRILRWCHRHRRPCFLWGDSNIRCDRVRGLTRRLKSALVRRAIRWCDGVFACGSLGKAYFERYGADPDRVFISPYEPDYQLIASLDPARIEQARQRFALDPARRRLVFSGRLVNVKRPDLLVDAFVALAPHRPDWDLLMIGDGVLGPVLRERVPAELRHRVIWTGFLDDQPTISALYRCSDVLVLPSAHEPWALVVNEAAASGLAIVASDVVGAAAELVRNGVNGHVFPVGDGQALLEALLDVTSSPQRLAGMKAASGEVLADWRRRGDPVAGIRLALQAVGVLPASPTA